MNEALTLYFVELDNNYLYMKKFYHKKQKEDNKEDRRDYKAMWFVSKEMEQYYKGGMETGLSELRYQLINRDKLLEAIDEAISFTNDPLTKKALTLAKERESLDRLIHARIIF